MQDEVARWKEKYASVANNLLPRAQSEANLAREDLVAARNQAKTAQEEANTARQRLEHMRLQYDQVCARCASIA
jgi:outer membrane murein-binding lipoprotein Lpp